MSAITAKDMVEVYREIAAELNTLMELANAQGQTARAQAFKHLLEGAVAEEILFWTTHDGKDART